MLDLSPVGASRIRPGAVPAAPHDAVFQSAKALLLQPSSSAAARPVPDRTFSAPPYSRLGDLRPPSDAAYWEGSIQQAGTNCVADHALSTATNAAPVLRNQIGEQISAVYAGPAQGDVVRTSHDTQSSAIAETVAEYLQLPIATLLQLIPPHLLDPSHERFSCTGLHLPVTSVEALLETFKAVNWLCASGAVGAGAVPRLLEGQERSTSPETHVPSNSSPGGAAAPNAVFQAPASGVSPPDGRSTTFDINELVQRAADVVSGQAAGKKIQLIIQLINDDEGNYGHPQLQVAGGNAATDPAREKRRRMPTGCSVLGDEGALRFGVIHFFSRVLHIAPFGSKLEVYTRTQPAAAADAGTLRCTIEAALYSDCQIDHIDLGNSGNLVCQSVLARAGIELRSGRVTKDAAFAGHEAMEAQPTKPAGLRVTYFLSALLRSGAKLVEAAELEEADRAGRQRFLPSITLGREPSFKELETLATQELHGKKVAVRARHDSAFAEQVGMFLALCDMDVARLPLQDEDVGGQLGREYWQSAAFQSPPSHTQEPKQQPSSLGHAPRTAVALSDGKPVLVNYPSDLSVPRAGNPANTSVEAGLATSQSAAVLNPITGEPAPLVGPATSSTATSSAEPECSASTGGPQRIEPFTFLMIDDDIRTLQVELLRILSAVPLLQSALHLQGSLGASVPSSPEQMGRPAFPPRPRSSPQVQRVLDAEVGAPSRSAYTAAPSRPTSPIASDSRSGTELQECTTTIIYFTSLANFRMVRDVVCPISESLVAGTGISLPAIIVVPKPAGMRRLLTTLHTALHKPLIDPFFHPIATSPKSPALFASYNRPFDFSAGGSSTADAANAETSGQNVLPRLVNPVTPTLPLLPQASHPDQVLLRSASTKPPLQSPHAEALPHSPSSTKENRYSLRLSDLPPADARMEPEKSTTPKSSNQGLLKANRIDSAHDSSDTASASARSHRSTTGVSSSRPSSPMSVDALEYFGEAAFRLGDGAARGLVVQSPDGRPAGIYFRPKSNSIRSSSSAKGNAGSTIREDPSAGTAVGAGASSGGGAADSQTEGASAGPGMVHRSLSSSLRKGGLAATDQSPRQSQRNLRPGSNTSAVPNSPSISTLLTPQVGIESVLNGSAPPVVGPLPQHIADVAPQVAAAAAQSPAMTPSLGSDPDRMHKKQVQAILGGAADRAVSGQANLHGALGFQRANPQSTTALPAHPLRGFDLNAAAKTPSTLHDAPMGRSPSKLKGTKNSLAQARQSFAMVQQPSAGAARPSAQPQAGLLIGAGFSQTQRRGTGPKRAPVREAILPPIKVLIVEDNAINIRILTRFMSRKNIQYEVANNGREAIDKWRNGGFHIIFMDIQLPVLDGIQATKEIRRLERHANIGIFPGTPPPSSPQSVGLSESRGKIGSSYASTSSGLLSVPGSAEASRVPMPSPFRASVIIVALTASSFNSDRVAALAAGCNDFLNKPVDHKWLEKKIIEWGSMQYILLSGFVSESVSRWRDPKSSKPGGGKVDDTGQASVPKVAAAGAAANSPRDLPREIQSNFDRIPNAQAMALASKLHIAPKKKKMHLEIGTAQTIQETPTPK
ncbi:hypothetical protein K437DRAFT_258736 [Tilletiaria anomala UBC 951]|uniref:Response regulatory domain-containing protein n=1 Tax=Tilletiaria anomala (strain ATCC 24038 / CBS 436.72 / UBC 951) TaxID=1037660 RepID=A0A066VN03_TILAU|nr:uncharacterized protein K437DRAFT_258736 [Tilletiaria anomala UBC 951]KDN40154.1 hypothetical protein K437DRAFT_258736 [Tilletiaria anomala UBC 951]